MRKFILLFVTAVVTSILFVGCLNKNQIETNETVDTSKNVEKTTDDVSKNVENKNEQTKQEKDELEFIEIKGKRAMIVEGSNLKNPYIITVNSEGVKKRKKLSDDKIFALKKNDLVVVIDEDDETCRVVQAFGDIPRLRGTIEKSKLDFDSSNFKKSANQVVLNNVMCYVSINGDEQGSQSGVYQISERKDEWVRISMPGGASDLWVKEKDLSYDFDTLIIDCDE